jgi:zinc/manganese transport system substrate-binding protein
MLHTFRWVLACLGFAIAGPAHADLRILSTTADWGALARELGGEHVDVYVATSPRQDVHRVEAKPSLIARARRANLVVANGAELEVGWLPVHIQESGNARIQPGSPGYFEAASQVKLREVPASFDRALGDIHPQGNPHIHLDPRNIALVAKGLSARLTALDSGNAPYYQRRLADFDARWRTAMARWQQKGASLKGVPVVVIHRDQAYLANWLGLVETATIEPKPGVPPSAGYLGRLVTRLSASPPKMILRNAYNDPKAVNWLSKRIGAPVVLLPYSVGGTPEAKDLFALYDDTLDRLLAANR